MAVSSSGGGMVRMEIMGMQKVHALRRNLRGPGGMVSIAWCKEIYEILDPRIVYESSFRTMARYSLNGVYLDRQLCRECADALDLPLP